MDHFFNLGSYRRGLVLAFAALVASFSFGQSDLTYLTSLVRSIDEHTDDISSDITILYYDQNEIKRLLINVEGDTFDIRSILSNLVFDTASQVRVTDTGVLHRVSSIDSKMDRIEQAINNLTNYMCYSSSYVDQWTNISSIVNALINNEYGRYEEDVVYYLTDILGRPPTSDEISRATDIVLYYGAYSREVLSNISRISATHFPSTSWDSFWQSYRRGVYNTSILTEGQNIGELYFYQYGTRQFTDSFLQYTNQIFYALNQINDSLTNHLDSRFISSTTSESGTSYGFTEAAGNVARGISESASQVFSIEDDITQVETNPIVAISDSGYQSRMNQATGSGPSDGLGQIADDLNGYLQEHETSLESILEDNPSDYTFYFEVPTFSTGLRSNTCRVAYVVPNTNSSTRPYLAFICGVIKFALSLYFAYYVWDKIVLDLWKF